MESPSRLSGAFARKGFITTAGARTQQYKSVLTVCFRYCLLREDSDLSNPVGFEDMRCGLRRHSLGLLLRRYVYVMIIYRKTVDGQNGIRRHDIHCAAKKCPTPRRPEMDMNLPATADRFLISRGSICRMSAQTSPAPWHSPAGLPRTLALQAVISAHSVMPCCQNSLACAAVFGLGSEDPASAVSVVTAVGTVGFNAERYGKAYECVSWVMVVWSRDVKRLSKRRQRSTFHSASSPKSMWEKRHSK